MNRILKIILILFIIISICFLFFYFLDKKISNINKEAQVAQALKAESSKKKDSIKTTTLFFVGDMMLARGVQSSVSKNFDGDYNRLFENLGELKEADILFANLEGGISDKGKNVGSKYSFRMDPKVLPAIKNSGIDILSFSNNHVGDWSIVAFKDTLTRLKENGILHVGAGFNKQEAINPTIVEKNNIKFGFIGFTDVGPNWLKATEKDAGVLLASDPLFPSIVKKAKEECDVLIVSIHWGEEYKKIHNKRQEFLAYTAIDNGADIIMGHHPHVIEDIVEYKGKTIVYSLGNFIFDQYFSEDTMKGMLFEATFEGTNLINTEQKEIILNRNYQPNKISEKEIENKIIVNNNCPKPSKQFIDMSLYNIGKTNPLMELYYVPDNLIPLDKSISNEGLCLKENIRDAFVQMKNDAEKDNVSIKITSAFRSYDTQKLLFTTKEKTSGNAGMYLAEPGHSEHQLGTAIDVSGASINYKRATVEFENTIEDIWLKNNAYKYGFTQSYPKDKESITAYAYEPWHYRYIGIENAKHINDNKITILEFLGSINKN